MDGETTFRGSRLTTLRHLDGLTQTELATRLRVSQGFISQIEREIKPFPEALAVQAGLELEVPLTFFSVPTDASEVGIATFRKSSRASARHEQEVTSLFGEAARLFRAASSASGYHSCDLESIAGEDEEATAANARSMLGLDPTDPVANATRAVERLGVGVIHRLVPLEAENRDHDGICRPSRVNDRPLIATVGEQPPVVTRMTVMHELGHLIYDRDLAAPIRGTRAPQERRAFRFAGAMLIPASVVRSRVTESLTLHGYLRVKAEYGISVAALIVRAADLGAISSQRKRSLFIQLSSQGWRRNEPVPVAVEQPRLLSQAVERGLSRSPRQVAEQVGMRSSQVQQWTGLREPVVAKPNVVPLFGVKAPHEQVHPN